MARARLWVCVLTALATLVGCTGDEAKPPSVLMDGTRAYELPVDLEDMSKPGVLTKDRVVNIAADPSPSAAATCVRAHGAAASPPPRAVERIGVSSSSVTFSTAAGIHGCDNSPGAREDGRRWCGTSFGVLTEGRLEDPRLDMAGCHTSSGEPLGFAWIEPAAQTRYVVAEQDGYVEVYEPAGALPIRIATATGVEIDGSRATFQLSEYDASGKLQRRYALEATPAG